ncbi:MAG: site-2 protease family protein [Rickettsiales bacterium]|nr:site-2 protease family protein [Rickettsiales bacterium]
MPEWVFDASSWIIPVILAVTLHEAAHGWMAERFHDNTARILGRVTFNPFKHIDRFGTIVLPGLLLLMQSPALFGYAKPVPVNFSQLRPARVGMFMVAIAGVLVNFILALISAFLLHIDVLLTPEWTPWVFQNLYKSILINCALIVFNMIPILPLDGGRAVDALLSGTPRRLYRKLERYGVIIVFAVVLLPPLLGSELSQQWLGKPIFFLYTLVLQLSGNGSIG